MQLLPFISIYPYVTQSQSQRKHDNIDFNRGYYSPRISLIQRLIPLLPDRKPRFPIPLYLAKGLCANTARTRTPLSSASNTSLSPGCTPSRRRTSCGTVICPLLVILASFCNRFSKIFFAYGNGSLLRK